MLWAQQSRAHGHASEATSRVLSANIAAADFSDGNLGPAGPDFEAAGPDAGRGPGPDNDIGPWPDNDIGPGLDNDIGPGPNDDNDGPGPGPGPGPWVPGLFAGGLGLVDVRNHVRSLEHRSKVDLEVYVES